MHPLSADFDRLAGQLAFSISIDQKQKLLAFVDLIVKWNKAYNLTSVRDPKDMLVKHIFDSIAVLPHLNQTSFADVGTGPGLPGIPLAIMCTDCEFTLIDSLGKRIRFIKQAVYHLELNNVLAIQDRVENIQNLQVEAVLSRAFASAKDMLSWCHHLAKQDGVFLALKGIIHQDELDEIPIGFKVIDVHKLLVPNLVGERHLLVIKQQ